MMAGLQTIQTEQCSQYIVGEGSQPEGPGQAGEVAGVPLFSFVVSFWLQGGVRPFCHCEVAVGNETVCNCGRRVTA